MAVYAMNCFNQALFFLLNQVGVVLELACKDSNSSRRYSQFGWQTAAKFVSAFIRVELRLCAM